jgi:hypothetical protein
MFSTELMCILDVVAAAVTFIFFFFLFPYFTRVKF